MTAERRHCSYYAVMTTITIRHVPDDVRDELAARAARTGRSLQEFLLGEIARLAAKPTVEQLLADVVGRKRRSGRVIPAADILADLETERR
jgi:antitoxin FitA